VSSEPLIAVIDDDEPFRTALVEAICSLGHRAQGFASAEEFFAASGESSCDCVITDVHMPGMSGLDLQRRLVTRDRPVPVIMITARGEPGLEDRVAASGAVCLLRKPFGADALIGCLEKALEI
jgi:FixJ family two-component response regulator